MQTLNMPASLTCLTLTPLAYFHSTIICWDINPPLMHIFICITELEVSSESLLCVRVAHSNHSNCMMLCLHKCFEVCRGSLDNVMVLMIWRPFAHGTTLWLLLFVGPRSRWFGIERVKNAWEPPRQWLKRHNNMEYQQYTWLEVSQRAIIQYDVLGRVKIGRLLGITHYFARIHLWQWLTWNEEIYYANYATSLYGSIIYT